MVTWEQLRDAVRGQGTAVRTASPARLDAYEQRIGFRFPPHYRDLAGYFGAGEFLHDPWEPGQIGSQRWVILAIPAGPDSPVEDRADLEDYNADQIPPRALDPANPPEPGRRLVIFARDVPLGDELDLDDPQAVYGWDPLEVTDPAGPEYAIYALTADGTVSRLADTFEDFLLRDRFGTALATWEAAGRPGVSTDPPAHDDPRIVFSPAVCSPDEMVAHAEPTDAGAEPDEDLVAVVHRVIIPPQTVNGQLLWTEVADDGTASIQIWIPGDARDRARLEAFRAACESIDWSDGAIHEIPGFAVREPTWTLPTEPLPPDPIPERPAPTLTPAGLIRREPRPAAPVAESWRRLEAFFTRNCPETLALLRPGATEAQVARFEQAIGQELPADLRASLMVHDGMLKRVPDRVADQFRASEADNYPRFYSRILFEYRLDPLLGQRYDESVLNHWRRWTDNADEEQEDGAHDTYGRLRSFPPGAIRLRAASRGWLPLANDGGNGSNYIGVDLAPGPTGVRGQVINFGRDEQHKYVLALGWAQFLEDYADELEAGNFHFDTLGYDDGTPKWPGARMLQPKQSRPGYSSLFGRQLWSEAKLPDDFLAAQPPRPTEPVPADPATATACRAVVEQFIADYHAWAVRWRDAFQLADLGFRTVGQEASGRFTAQVIRPADDSDPALGPPSLPGAAFARSPAWDDPVRRAAFFRALPIGQHADAVATELRSVFDRSVTASVRRLRQRGEVKNHEARFQVELKPRYDPALQRVARVLLRDDGAALVELEPQSDGVHRFLLKREGDQWRIDLRYMPFQGKEMHPWSL